MLTTVTRYLNDLPVRHKLLLLTGVVTILALCLAVIAVTVANWMLYRSQILQNAQAQAELLAANSISPLIFEDSDAAQKNLEPLKRVPSIAAVVVYDKNGLVYARYYRNDLIINIPHLRPEEGYRYQTNRLIIQKLIEVNEEDHPVGKLIMVNDLQVFYQAQDWVWLLTALSAVIGMMGGYLLFRWGQRLLTEPVKTLTDAMNLVRNDHDYTLRIQPQSKDELGELAHGFNDMLQQIQKRDQRLERYNRDLEYAVEQRTEELAITMAGLREARDRAEQANQAKSRFLTNVSHELRTPLNAILGFAEILKQQAQKNLELKYLDIISSSGKTLLNLINEILDLARIESGKIKLDYRTVNFPRLIQNVSSFFRPKAEEKRLQFRLELPENLPQAILTDENRLQQVLINLLGNAVKFTFEGHVTLRIETEWHKTSQVNLRISVIDSGIGIADDEQERIFRAFEQQSQQSQNEFGGTGLGLTITKNLVDLMHGEIQVFSKPNLGSCFTVTLHDLEVLSSADIVKQTEDNLTQDMLLFAPARIIIADELAINRQLLKAYLSNYPFGVSEVDSSQQLWAALEKQTPNLIFIDLKLAAHSDDNIFDNLKYNNATHKIPVIGVADLAMQHETQALQTLCNGYLTKPINRSALLRCLAAFLPNQLADVHSEEKRPDTAEEQAINCDLQDVLQQYRTDWENLNELSAINSVEDFADNILELTQQYHCSALKNWAERLQEQASSFDIVNLPETLQEFEQFLSVSTVEKSCN